MCIYASKAVWQKSESKGSARLVLLCIADHINAESRVAYPSLDTIADETKVSRRQVSRAISELENLGELEVLHKGNGRGFSTVYRILIDTEAPKKDDICDKKDDMVSSFNEDEEPKKDDMVSEKDDTLSKKDDTMSSQPLLTINNHYLYKHAQAQDSVSSMITLMSQFVKDRDILTNKDKWEDAAFSLIGWEATEQQFRDFSEWWKVNGYYSGLPAIKSLVGEWRNFLAGVQAATPPQKVDKQQLANDVWDVVCRNGRRGYRQAKQQLNGQWQYIEQMGKWANVCDMNEQTFRIKFFEAMNKVNNGQ